MMVKQLIEELSCWYYTGYFQPDEDNDEDSDEDLQEFDEENETN